MKKGSGVFNSVEGSHGRVQTFDKNGGLSSVCQVLRNNNESTKGDVPQADRPE